MSNLIFGILSLFLVQAAASAVANLFQIGKTVALTTGTTIIINMRLNVKEVRFHNF